MSVFAVATARFGLQADRAPSQAGASATPEPEPARDPRTDELITEEPASHEQSESTPIDRTSDDYLLGLLPTDRREEAKVILQTNPNAREILRLCGRGHYNCWTAMEMLGMQPLINDSPEPESIRDLFEFFGCACCESQYKRWCYVPEVEKYFNIEILEACPREAPLTVCLPLQNDRETADG